MIYSGFRRLQDIGSLFFDYFMNGYFDGIATVSKRVLYTDFFTPQGHIDLVPVEMTEVVILSGVKRSRRICTATTFRLAQ